MWSFCSTIDSYLLLDLRQIFDFKLLRPNGIFSSAVLQQILSYLVPSVDNAEDEHYCSPLHPCALVLPQVLSFLQMRLVCHDVNLICRILYDRGVHRDDWDEPRNSGYGSSHLKHIIKRIHLEGRYRHCFTLQQYDAEGSFPF